MEAPQSSVEPARSSRRRDPPRRSDRFARESEGEGEGTSLDATRRPAEAPPIRCAACRSPVTSSSERIEVAGIHVLARTNPLGAEFRFGCFRAAPGAAVVGPASLEATWFAGRPWRFALCRRCGLHLGWRWEGEGGGFFGLILDRLSEEPDDGAEG